MAGERPGLLFLKVVVNAQLVGCGEATLGPVVAISKVVTMAGRLEREAQRVVRGGRAIIRGPVKGRRVPGVSASGESRERDGEEDLVRDCHRGLGTRKTRES